MIALLILFRDQLTVINFTLQITCTNSRLHALVLTPLIRTERFVSPLTGDSKLSFLSFFLLFTVTHTKLRFIQPQAM